MTVVTVGLVAVAAVLAVVVALAGALAIGETKAQGAADASALAAASDARDRRALGQAYRGSPYGGTDAAPCRVAREVAEGWGAAVSSCGVEPGGVVTVEVKIAVGVGEVSATARAGPNSRSRRKKTAAPDGHAKRATRCAGESPVRVPSSS